MDTLKKCFKCGDEKPRSEFYAHPMMADGLLGKCKTCTKADVKSHRRDPRYREKVLSYDRARGNRQDVSYLLNYREAFPEKNSAVTAVNNAVRDGRIAKAKACEHCGARKPLHGHHPDYSYPLCVVWLCAACHRQWHAMDNLMKSAIQKFEGAA